MWISSLGYEASSRLRATQCVWEQGQRLRQTERPEGGQRGEEERGEGRGGEGRAGEGRGEGEGD